MKYFFLFLSCFLQSNIKNTSNLKPINDKNQYPILLLSWQSEPKGKKKFVMTNHKKEILLQGYLEWNLEKNEWIFHYDRETIRINNNKIFVSKKGIKNEKCYQCSGFSKILSHPIEKWQTIIPFDNEIEMDNTCYTEFKTNKSYLIIYFQIKPFKLITITFGENRENYILFFDESML